MDGIASCLKAQELAISQSKTVKVLAVQFRLITSYIISYCCSRLLTVLLVLVDKVIVQCLRDILTVGLGTLVKALS